MALDGAFLRHIKKEIELLAVGSRIDKIYQPNKEEIIISLRTRADTYKLLISSRANSPRIHFTKHTPENPASPPMLCMLLRKKLSGAKLCAVRQPGLERLLYLDFDAKNELGDAVTLTLVVEIMGKYSNIILIDEQEKIIDAIKRVDAEMSSQRLILPGIKYTMPPAQNKLCILDSLIETVIDNILSSKKDEHISKSILSVVQGISPVVCREIENSVDKTGLTTINNLDSQQIIALKDSLSGLAKTTKNCDGKPYMIIDNFSKPIEFSFVVINQYEGVATIKEFGTFSELLDEFYFERDRIERMRVRSQDLLKVLNNCEDRIRRKIGLQKEELHQCSERKDMRICGDLLNANLYKIKKGAAFVDLENFYDESMAIKRIKLDPAISASENAQRYYKNYHKAKTAESILVEQIDKAQAELKYIESVLDLLSRAECERDLIDIRNELTEQGYLKSPRSKQKNLAAQSPIEFKSTNGFTILVGRNNKQNDKLTLKQANNNDLWFHTKDIPGSHTIIISNGEEVDEQSILEAGIIAAYHSKAKLSSNVPVDFAQIRYVKKPQGAKPGMVIYTNNHTIYVTPDKNLVNKLKI